MPCIPFWHGPAAIFLHCLQLKSIMHQKYTFVYKIVGSNVQHFNVDTIKNSLELIITTDTKVTRTNCLITNTNQTNETKHRNVLL